MELQLFLIICLALLVLPHDLTTKVYYNGEEVTSGWPSPDTTVYYKDLMKINQYKVGFAMNIAAIITAAISLILLIVHSIRRLPTKYLVSKNCA